ncbi:MAG: enoyl-CoA hydratase [Dehalococcoidia bacterium]
MTDEVLYEQRGGVGVITLNRPESLNAMNNAMLDALPEVGRRAEEDPAVRCVLITGAGRAFCAGGDVKGMTGGRGEAGLLDGGSFDQRVTRLRAQEEISRLLYEMPKPTVAAINGHAVGAGLSVALAADIRIASEQAKFGTAFGRVGFSGDFGGTWLLQRLVGPGKAKELYLLGDIIGAERALELGMVTKVVPHESLMDEAMALAERLAAGPTLAFARMKENFVMGATASLADTLGKEAENMIASSDTVDHREAAKAFVEKREPTFRGA